MAGHVVTIGLDRVDASKYRSWSGELLGAEQDALAMMKVCKESLGFTPAGCLTNEGATKEAVLAALKLAADPLKAGDTLLLTFSGHGSRVRDHHDPSGGHDRVWILYDRPLVDDELYSWLVDVVRPGVRMIGVSDCCLTNGDRLFGYRRVLGKAVPGAVVVENSGLWNADAYMVQEGLASWRKLTWKASVVHLYACRKHQAATDGLPNSLFTGLLVDALRCREVRNIQGYEPFIARLRNSMPPWQVPEVEYVTSSANGLRSNGRVFDPGKRRSLGRS